MDSDHLNRWLTLLANIGVVVGLALLIVELRQAQKLAETQATVRRLEQMQVAQVEYATSDYLVPIKVKARADGVQSLSRDELERLRVWENTIRLRMYSQYVEYQRGYLDPAAAETILNAAAENLPFWEELGYQLGDNDFEQALRRFAGRQESQ